MAVPRETWTDEKVETLKRLHAAGEPFSTIGRMVGMTRNASIGKARRLGLLRREERKTAIKAAREPKPKAARPDKPRGIMPAGGLPKDPEARRDVFCAIAGKANDRFAATMVKVAEAGSEGVLFLERGLFQCAMPMAGWDEAPVQEKRVCGRAVKVKPREGLMSSYCPDCSRIVYAPQGIQAIKYSGWGTPA